MKFEKGDLVYIWTYTSEEFTTGVVIKNEGKFANHEYYLVADSKGTYRYPENYLSPVQKVKHKFDISVLSD